MRSTLLMLVALVLTVVPVTAGSPKTAARPRSIGTLMTSKGPEPASTSAVAKSTAAYDEQRLLAGHLLRRIGFGPNQQEMDAVLSMGMNAYIEMQLNPESIDDSEAEQFFVPEPRDPESMEWTQRWITRMVYSRRQLLEKMTLLWHEHFATSNAKVGATNTMRLQEQLFRQHALGSFRDLLVDITTNPAMLVYLDNNYNMGRDYDGNPVTPNENYARELLQLFSLGTDRLNMDGTPIIGANGLPEPAYTEQDVREVARALTGWWSFFEEREGYLPAQFEPAIHDPWNKVIFGQTLIGRDGAAGASEVEGVVDLIMQNPSCAPFISKELILKLATETPTPGYIQRVSTVFRSTGGDLRATVRAILTDPEFTSPAVVRTQYKTPLEHLLGPIRALGGSTRGLNVLIWTWYTGHQPYLPPSVFSFYRPGKKGGIVTTSQVSYLDTFADDFVDTYTDEWYDASFNARQLMAQYKLKKPKKAVDFLADRLLAAPLDPQVRQAIIDYAGGRKKITEDKFRGAAWLIISSPDFQLN
jgi:uncharacterized protein (DUF1800 family)